MIALEYDRLLIVAVGLVTAGELGQMDLCLLTVIISNTNRLGRYISNGSRFLGYDTDTGVYRCLYFHTGTNHRSLSA